MVKTCFLIYKDNEGVMVKRQKSILCFWQHSVLRVGLAIVQFFQMNMSFHATLQLNNKEYAVSDLACHAHIILVSRISSLLGLVLFWYLLTIGNISPTWSFQSCCSLQPPTLKHFRTTGDLFWNLPNPFTSPFLLFSHPVRVFISHLC